LPLRRRRGGGRHVPNLVGGSRARERALSPLVGRIARQRGRGPRDSASTRRALVADVTPPDVLARSSTITSGAARTPPLRGPDLVSSMGRNRNGRRSRRVAEHGAE